MMRSSGAMPERASLAAKWVFAAAFLTAPLTTLRPVGSVTLGDLFLLPAFGLAFLAFVYRRSLPPVPKVVWAGAGVLLLSIAVTVLWPPASTVELAEAFDPAPYGSTLSGGMRLMIALIALPIAIALVVDRWSTISFLANAWIVGVSISCLVAVIDAFTGIGLQDVFANDPELLSIFQNGVPPRYMGLSVHPTSFSVTAVMVLPVVLAKMTTKKSAVVLSPVVVLLLLGTVLSGSRVGILAMVVVAGIYVCVSPNLRKIIFGSGIWMLALAAAVAAVTVLIFLMGPPVDPSNAEPQPPDSSSTRFDPSIIGSDTSSKERLQRLEDSVDFISERPFLGYGFEWIEASHSIYLQLLVSGGVLALIGFLLVMWGYAKSWLIARMKVPDKYRELMLGLAVSVVAFLMMGLAQTDLLDRYVYLPVGLIMAAYALALRDQTEAEPGN